MIKELGSFTGQMPTEGCVPLVTCRLYVETSQVLITARDTTGKTVEVGIPAEDFARMLMGVALNLPTKPAA